MHVMRATEDQHKFRLLNMFHPLSRFAPKVWPGWITRHELLQDQASAVKAYIRVIYAEMRYKRAVIRGSLSFQCYLR